MDFGEKGCARKAIAMAAPPKSSPRGRTLAAQRKKERLTKKSQSQMRQKKRLLGKSLPKKRLLGKILPNPQPLLDRKTAKKWVLPRVRRAQQSIYPLRVIIGAQGGRRGFFEVMLNLAS